MHMFMDPGRGCDINRTMTQPQTRLSIQSSVGAVSSIIT